MAKKAKRAIRPVKLGPARRKTSGIVTQWQVIKARVEAEIAAQVKARGFMGSAVLIPDQLEYQHNGHSDLVTKGDLERFAMSLVERQLATSTSASSDRVAIVLTANTIAIMAGSKIKPTAKASQARAKIPPSIPAATATRDFDLPAPDLLLGPIRNEVTKCEANFADVRKVIAVHFSIPPDATSVAVFSPITRQRMSFSDVFQLATGHLQKSGILKLDGKRLCLVAGGAGKPTPPYKPKAKRPAASSPQGASARMQGPVDVERLMKSLPELDSYRLLTMWKNAVRIIGDATRKPLHQDAQIMASAVSKEWDLRAKRLADDAYFKWPSTEAPGGKKHQKYRDLRQEGMLRYLEYKVGKEGEHSNFRHALLARIFESGLPPVFDRVYMAEWGPNASSIRLHKMAHCLASFAKNFKYQDDDKFDEAIRHWEQDLEYLHDRFYVGRFGFGWPTTAI
ncbi:hypothetical protein [Rhizobium rhododendri]|uniref:Uncharacterized protein n=1 Tax=Rhizobium rhododendri TaxID=2506430 RepID=A0ABY8ILN7_9HYPH|nr:hypothetical protein [Rhizobium rhododendri]WFS23920.1 hypothetical protein PR018_05315 [Rhizobium rhododendri]